MSEGPSSRDASRDDSFREDDLLRRVRRASAELTVRWPQRIAIGPGDDMAAIHITSGLSGGLLLTAIDQVIVGRHVRHDTPWKLVGRKAVARNLSDIAAMAARPLACVASVAMPRGTSTARAMELFDGLRGTAEAYGCPLIGGDTGSFAGDDDPLVVSVSVIADTPPSRGPIRRVGAAVGDDLFVTGLLGGAWRADGGGRHLSFAPRLPEATELVEAIGADLHAMIDLSDGLGRDAGRLGEASSARMIIDAALLPCTPGCDWRRAVGDGEDYELLFAAAPGAAVPPRLGETPVTRIGTVAAITADSALRVASGAAAAEIIVDGESIAIDQIGWEHGGEHEWQGSREPQSGRRAGHDAEGTDS